MPTYSPTHPLIRTDEKTPSTPSTMRFVIHVLVPFSSWNVITKGTLSDMSSCWYGWAQTNTHIFIFMLSIPTRRRLLDTMCVTFRHFYIRHVDIFILKRLQLKLFKKCTYKQMDELYVVTHILMPFCKGKSCSYTCLHTCTHTHIM